MRGKSENDETQLTAKGLAWDSFKQTGRIGFYMLYRALEGDDDDKSDRYRNEK